MRTIVPAIIFFLNPFLLWASKPEPPVPLTVSDYDEGDFYLMRGDQKLPYHGMRDAWVYNRAMQWLDQTAGIEGALLCYSEQSPLLLTGAKQVSRWYAGKSGELGNADELFTKFVKRNAKSTWDHAALPPLQFQIEQHSTAELEVRDATHPWQLIVVVKGRGGPPLYCSPWQRGPDKLKVDLLNLYRQKGYEHHFAEMNFFLAVWTPQPEQEAAVTFRLQLVGGPAIIPSLPVIRTRQRADQDGVPIYAVVLDEKARRLNAKDVEVTATVAGKRLTLKSTESAVWKAEARDLPVGHHQTKLHAVWKTDRNKTVHTTLDIHVSDGQYVGYDPKLKLLTKEGVPLGPVTGSYRGQLVFRNVGTPSESLLHGENAWKQAISDPERPNYGFHWWESLTPAELDADYEYLNHCGWRMVHLCSAWLWWPRFDAAGRVSPFYAEQIYAVCRAAERHGLNVHLALSHYPTGCISPPYEQYLEAGFRQVPRGQRPPDYEKHDSEFYRLFENYMAQFFSVFRDETALSSFTSAGEGDSLCGPIFVNAVHDALKTHAPNHLMFCEPHHPISQDPNYYRTTGWKPLVGGMRAYDYDRAAEYRQKRPVAPSSVQYRLSAMGHIFLAEGAFYGFLGGNHQYMLPDQPMDCYRECVRNQLYSGLALRNPILLTWEERIVEDERCVFEQIRTAVDWSKPFETPPLAIRIGSGTVAPSDRGPLLQYEEALARLPLNSIYLWEDEPAPDGVLHVIDARQPFVMPAFRSDGGDLPDSLKSHVPLRLPEGWEAVYSWATDRHTLLAYLYRSPTSEFGEAATFESGDDTYIDTQRMIDSDMRLDTWEVQCLKPGSIQLRIYRRENDELRLVGQSGMATMTRLGVNRFTLDEPIAAKQGDLTGFYIPNAETEIGAQPGGRMLFVEGMAPDKSPVDQWQTEPKTANLRAFSAADLTPAKPRTPQPTPGLVLQNFPSEELRYQLFDLATKETIAEGNFQNTQTLEPPADTKHLFLLVNEGRHTQQAQASPEGETLWYNGTDLVVQGKGWTDTQSFYDRLPAKAEKTAPASVWTLSHHSAGLCIRFNTDAPTIGVRWTVTSGNLASCDMPATAVSGVDLYARNKAGRWQFVGNGPASGESNTASFTPPPSNEYLLYLPLYNGTKSVEIGIPKGRTIAKPGMAALQQLKPLVFYGTSITQAFRAPFPFDAQENSAFFNEHPQYHCLDRIGQPVSRLSYAYPEVQAYMLNLIKEIVDYEPDGVCLCLIRGVPLVHYEPIMVDGFKQKYSVDPRQLDEQDPRWMDYQGMVLTSFVKQVKQALKPNQRLSVIVPGNELDCRRWGLDVARWVKEGIIDDLLPTGQRFDHFDVHYDDTDSLDFRYFARLEGRDRIRLIPMLDTWDKFSADFAAWEQLMQSFLDQGADAYCVWDGWESPILTKVQQIGAAMKDYQRPPPPAFREIKLLRLQGFRMDRYHYFEVI